ncbi:hypothetical protein SAMN04487829_2091 [Pseudobutyrivibrio sp. NOR37]|uniref:Uncharacterized protein n=2 Tax=Pseudobutyrivibrio TaxID=46205 RepID=A0A6M0LNR1_PSEXY|nr:hypothetical protein [Pseudobutyrivibrio xylanivorans]NEX02461.1 hypothetical protein [Pseudobutyrivibrio xylanivorans]SFR79403.1 hypothetical protein SAMN04487829_2091 [Pseudobutyrivibrio sp. NOR37]
MKKKVIILMMATMMLSLVACQQDTKSESAGELEVESNGLNTELVQEQQTSETNQENDSEITADTEGIEDVVEDDSYDFGDMDPLYVSYLKNEISVENPYVEGEPLNILAYKEDYTSEFENATIKYALVEVNGDTKSELIVDIRSDVDQLMEILTVSDGKLILLDVFESHNMRMGTSVYANGVVCEERGYDDKVTEYFKYKLSGDQKPIITFYKAEDSDSDLTYDYYYLVGNEDEEKMISSDEEYERIRAKYVGNSLEFTDITDLVESL